MPAFERRVLGLPALFSVLGIAFSLWNLWGTPESLCVTEGCSLFQDFTVAGISLWWLGVAGFAALLGCALTGYGFLGFALSGTGIVLDSVLLIIMLVTAPCFNCLIIGLMLALTYAAFRHAEHDKRRGPQAMSILLVLWTALFVINIGGIVRASVGPWALEMSPAVSSPAAGRGNQATAEEKTTAADAAVQVYFSPTCSACQGLVAAAGGENGLGTGQAVAWYPVAENSRDIVIIADTINRMRTGASLDIAMKAALVAAPERVSSWNLSSPSMLTLQFRLWRNKAHVLNAGSGRLPFVEFRGAPAALTQHAKTPEPVPSGSAGSGSATSGLTENSDSGSVADTMANQTRIDLPFLDVGGFCDGATSAEPCDANTPPISVNSGISQSPL